MKQRVYLLGGADILDRNLSAVNRRWVWEANSRPMCVVDLANKDRASRPRYRSLMQQQFAALTDNNLTFLSELRTSEEKATAIREAGVIYVPTGDVRVLLGNLAESGLSALLSSGRSIVVGNGAGAVAVGRSAVIPRDDTDESTTILPGLGLVDYSVVPEYINSYDTELARLSRKRVVYGLPRHSALIAGTDSTEFMGPVWRFAGGDKEQVN